MNEEIPCKHCWLSLICLAGNAGVLARGVCQACGKHLIVAAPSGSSDCIIVVLLGPCPKGQGVIRDAINPGYCPGCKTNVKVVLEVEHEKAKT